MYIMNQMKLNWYIPEIIRAIPSLNSVADINFVVSLEVTNSIEDSLNRNINKKNYVKYYFRTFHNSRTTNQIFSYLILISVECANSSIELRFFSTHAYTLNAITCNFISKYT